MSDMYGGAEPASGNQTPAAAPPPAPQAPYQQPYGQAPYGVPPAGLDPAGPLPLRRAALRPVRPAPVRPARLRPPGFGVRNPDARPGTVLAAGIVTLVVSGLSLLGLCFTLVALIVISATIDNEARQDTFLSDGTDAISIALVTVLMLWSVAAILLAVFALRRSHGARIALVVSSGLTIAASLLAAIAGDPLAVAPMLGAVAVIVLLFTGGAGEWYRGRHDMVAAGQPG